MSYYIVKEKSETGIVKYSYTKDKYTKIGKILIPVDTIEEAEILVKRLQNTYDRNKGLNEISMHMHTL